MRNTAQAVAQCLLFVLTVVINYVTTSNTLETLGLGGAVRFTNAQIADTHPVYGLPAGWAFAIWGVIFLTLGLFTCYQALPAKRFHGGLDEPLVARIRAPVMALELCNAAWLFLFGYGQFWLALYLIVLYDALLFLVLHRLNVDYFASAPGATSRAHSLATKLLVATPFSVHAGWVTVASLLNVQVALLEEGWLPSADFSAGLIGVAVAIACAVVYTRADVPYALASAWALTGIITNQDPRSTFGCAARICAACTAAAASGHAIPICDRPNTSPAGRLPDGWAGLQCATWSPSNASAHDTHCLVPKSDVVIGYAAVGVACVLVAVVAAVVRAACFSKGGGRRAATMHVEVREPLTPGQSAGRAEPAAVP